MLSRRLICCALLFSVVPAAWCAAPFQSSPSRARGLSPGDYLGGALAAGDVDRDGRTDMIVGAYTDLPAAQGSVTVYSGRDGSVMGKRFGQQVRGGFGEAVAAGDVDGDGNADLIVGAPHNASYPYLNGGNVFVYSGRTGDLIYQFDPTADAQQLGDSVAAADLDGDGCAEIIAGAPIASKSDRLYNTGEIRVWTGRTGKPMLDIWGPERSMGIGQSVLAADVDGDGRLEIVSGTAGLGSQRAGTVLVFSGREGKLLRKTPSPYPSGELGLRIAAADVNRDGRADIIAGARSATPKKMRGAGAVVVFSGKDGSQLLNLPGSAPGEELGSSVAAADVDRDGTSDILAGAADALEGLGTVRVFSGKDGHLITHVDGRPEKDYDGLPSYGGFGTAVLPLDVDRDGYTDVLAGAPVFLNHPGSLFLFFGSKTDFEAGAPVDKALRGRKGKAPAAAEDRR